MIRLTQMIDVALKHLLIWLSGAMVLVVTWQVATRYLLNSPSSFTEELATYLLIWISLLGAVYALRLRAHLGIDILTRNLSGKREKLSQWVSYGAVIVFSAAVFVYGGTRLVYVTLYLEQLSAALKIPVGYVYTVLPLCGVLMIYYAVFALMYPDDRVETGDTGYGGTE